MTISRINFIIRFFFRAAKSVDFSIFWKLEARHVLDWTILAQPLLFY